VLPYRVWSDVVRTQFVSLLGLLLVAAAAAEDLPSVSSVDALVGTDGKETWGHVSACVLSRQDKVVACFGLDKRAKEPARYTYLAIFKHDPKMPRENGGTETQFKVDAGLSRMMSKFNLGDLELILGVDKQLDATDGKVLKETLTLGDKVVGKEARVFVIDLSQGKVTVVPIKVELPKSAPDLADQEHKTWSAALDNAIAELKAKSPEAKKLLE
jgi:hypothetical protein